MVSMGKSLLLWYTGRQGALLDPPVSLSLKRGIAAGRDVHFMGRLPDIGMASDLRTGTAAMLMLFKCQLKLAVDDAW